MKHFEKIRMNIMIRLHNYLYRRIGSLAIKINDNIHPKHRIMKYHNFFLINIENNSKVLDIGCGNGIVAYLLSKKVKSVIACDINKKSLKIAKNRFARHNIKFLIADATKYNFKEVFDYVILSNVLEHIENRIKFLNKIKTLTRFILIRIPMINRSWLTLYKKEMGFDYKLDPSHHIEYTLESFQKEMKSVNLKILSYSIQFGEIWAMVET